MQMTLHGYPRTRFDSQHCVVMTAEPNNNYFTRSELPLASIELETYEAPPGTEKLNVIKLENLEQYVKSMNESGGFKEQYQILKNGPLKAWIVAQQEENKNKNRYADLLPYDDCRVVLEKYKNDPSSTYINASYVDCYSRKKAFICTQGPLEKTIGDFWRMIWQESVHVIAMTANIVESGKKKCEKYWPDKGAKYDDIFVTFIKEEVHLEQILRIFKIQKSGTSGARFVRQYQYVAWPDHGVPPYPLSLVYLLQDIEMYQTRQQPNTSPIVLHCSAGVGRSGTVALLAASLKMLAAEGKVDVVGLLYKIRQQRVNLIETVEQFRFVYEALVEHYFGDISRRLSAETVVYLNKLRQVKVHQGIRKTGLQLQFESLNSSNLPHSKQKCISASTPANASKNRDRNILPPDDGRPILKTSPPLNYINAVYVPDYGKVNQFIATQFPLPTTIVDFWQMVYDVGSSTIVVLNEIRKSDETNPVFWPPSGNLFYGNFKLECLSMESEYFNGVLIRKLKLRNTKGSLKSRIIKMFHLHGWAKEDLLPPQIETLVQLYNKVRHWHKKTDGKPIIVSCYDGCRASGFYCVASFLAKQVKESEYVDVFNAVRTVRLNRPAFISTVEQYRWLYELACLLVNSKKILK